MHVVIDIPDHIYDAIMDAKKHRDQAFGGRTYLQMLVKGVEEGTVLPPDHGPLIDADEVMKQIEEEQHNLMLKQPYEYGRIWEASSISHIVMNSQPVIPAERENQC